MKKVLATIFVSVFVFLGINIDAKNVQAVSVGSQLLYPEDGWTRIDDQDENFHYSEGWDGTLKDVYRYKSTVHRTIKGNQTIKFNFFGTKFRYISDDYNGEYYYTKDVKIKIDDYPEENIDQGTNWRGIYQCILYEKKDMPLKLHEVNITVPAKSGWDSAMLDAIDIDENCFLSTPSKVKIDLASEEQYVGVGKEIKEDLYINNLDKVKSEDIEVTYDSSKVQFLGLENVDGVRPIICKNQGHKIIIFLTHSNKRGKSLIGKLKFKTISSGNASIKVTKGRVFDNFNKDINNLRQIECGQTTIFIKR